MTQDSRPVVIDLETGDQVPFDGVNLIEGKPLDLTDEERAKLPPLDPNATSRAYGEGKELEPLPHDRGQLPPLDPNAQPGAVFAMPFVIAQLLAGRRFRRISWPRGSYVFRQNGYPQGIPINENSAKATGLAVGTVCSYKPYLQFYDARSSAFEMYTLTNDDLFASDWIEVK